MIFLPGICPRELLAEKTDFPQDLLFQRVNSRIPLKAIREWPSAFRESFHERAVKPDTGEKRDVPSMVATISCRVQKSFGVQASAHRPWKWSMLVLVRQILQSFLVLEKWFPMPADQPNEIFDVCDEMDQVVGQAPRHVVHAQGLIHRAVHIWVFRTDGRLLVHKRSMTKDEYPGCITSSASGHLAAGEDYSTAAVRELHEELGLSGELTFVLKLPASPETAHEHTVLYRLTTDQAPVPDPAEIASVDYRDISELKEQIASNPEAFSPPFRSLIAAYPK